MGNANQIILTLNVPSVEEAMAWYDRILGWKAGFDAFDSDGKCLFGSVMLQENPWIGINLARSAINQTQCEHASIWIYIENVDVIYRRVQEQGWPIQAVLKDEFWGDRLFRIRDLNGNELVIAQKVV